MILKHVAGYWFHLFLRVLTYHLLEKAHILTIIDLFLLTWDNLILDMPDFTDELKMVSFRIGLLLKTEKLVNTADNILSLVQKLS